MVGTIQSGSGGIGRDTDSINTRNAPNAGKDKKTERHEAFLDQGHSSSVGWAVPTNALTPRWSRRPSRSPLEAPPTLVAVRRRALPAAPRQEQAVPSRRSWRLGGTCCRLTCHRLRRGSLRRTASTCRPAGSSARSGWLSPTTRRIPPGVGTPCPVGATSWIPAPRSLTR